MWHQQREQHNNIGITHDSFGMEWMGCVWLPQLIQMSGSNLELALQLEK